MQKVLPQNQRYSLSYSLTGAILYLDLTTGKGAVYGYDAVGSFKRDDYGAMGSGQNFVMPILDNLVTANIFVI